MLVLIGKSTSGKDTIKNKLIAKHGFHGLTTYTSRPMRTGEIPDVTYHYISDEEFKQKIEDGFFAEHKTYLAKINEDTYEKWYYGTALEDLQNADENTVVILTPEGVRDILKYNLDMKVIWIYANQSTIDKRMAERVKRGQANQSENERRQIKDHKDFKVADCLADKIVYNNYDYDLDEVIQKILGYYRE